MVYDPKQHHRRSIRLKGYNYRSDGVYFVTIDVKKWLQLFGTIRDGKMYLNDAGLMIQKIWIEIPDYYQGVLIDEFVVMPHHFHGIVVLKGGQTWEFARTEAQYDERRGFSLSDVIQRFKSLTTKKYIDGVKEENWPRFDGKLWHRNYYERIIRKQKEWDSVRHYIRSNPMNWNRRGNPP